jgi:hypothetical protein
MTNLAWFYYGFFCYINVLNEVCGLCPSVAKNWLVALSLFFIENAFFGLLLGNLSNIGVLET